MTFDCADFDRLTDPHDDADREEHAAWQVHLDACARCSEQLAADEALRLAFAKKPDLTFSPGFTASLRLRLTERRLRQTMSRKARGVLLGYVAFALASSTWIVATIDWVGTGVWRAHFGLTVLALAAAPLMLVAWARSLPTPRPR